MQQQMVYSRGMPRKNIIKHYGAGEYYHVYNRGALQADIFRDDNDYRYLLYLFKRHLGEDIAKDRSGREVPNYHGRIELTAYCLMPNHYHLMVYLLENDGLEKLMRSVMTSYSRYFNRKYQRSGTLFQNPFLAVRITTQSYFWHVSRYIHLNAMDLPGDYLRYPYSSIGYFIGEKHADWVHPERIVELSSERQAYLKFLREYETRHDELRDLKQILADAAM